MGMWGHGCPPHPPTTPTALGTAGAHGAPPSASAASTSPELSTDHLHLGGPFLLKKRAPSRFQSEYCRFMWNICETSPILPWIFWWFCGWFLYVFVIVNPSISSALHPHPPSHAGAPEMAPVPLTSLEVAPHGVFIIQQFHHCDGLAANSSITADGPTFFGEILFWGVSTSHRFSVDTN